MNNILNVLNDKNDSTNITEKHCMLSAFKVSFFAMCRLSSFPWATLEMELQDDESSEVLLKILKQTCLHSLCRKTPPSVKYRRLFLSELIKRHEATTAEPLDELYDALGEVLGAEEESVCYKSYLLPSGDAISLEESMALISEGTTGLVTWEAALYLAEWALENRQVFAGRTVLELGSGVGLTGVAVCRSCSPRRYVFSDCHPCVLQRLQRNVHLNGLAVADGDGVGVAVEELDWAAVTEDHLQELGFDTVIASESAGIRHQVVEGPVTPVFPYNRTSAIEMIKLYL
ncbi:hypothetical protein JZ751_003476 [Albula glossodonta]|uniref:FAM86 N-terminal domain-containing protein n=1 Tax=Albula glossodonta TaxID=121402 RepID=A0A8T2N689_9TELE|nr:hypothetical protein JZ751_003476 [Albula glossodonta]